MRFEGKVLFTTGAGSGLAEAVSRRFSAEGGRVAVSISTAPRPKRWPPSSRDRSGSSSTSPTRSRSQPPWRHDRRARPHRLRLQRRRSCRLRADRGVVARALEPDDRRPRRRHVPLLQAHPAASSRGGRRLDRQRRLDRGDHGAAVQRALRRRQGRDRRVHAPALARRRARHPRQRRRARTDQDRDDDPALHRARRRRLREGGRARDPGHPDGEDRRATRDRRSRSASCSQQRGQLHHRPG